MMRAAGGNAAFNQVYICVCLMMGCCPLCLCMKAGVYRIEQQAWLVLSYPLSSSAHVHTIKHTHRPTSATPLPGGANRHRTRRTRKERPGSEPSTSTRSVVYLLTYM